MAKENKEYTFNYAKYYDRVPMIDFIDSLTEKEQAKLYFYIDKFIEMKNSNIIIKENLTKHIEEGIFELRVEFENRISISFFFMKLTKKLSLQMDLLKKLIKLQEMKLIRRLKLDNFIRNINYEYCSGTF